MEIDINALVSGVAALAAAYFSYNQYAKNKLTDLKIEHFKTTERRLSYKRSENSAKVYGELWKVLYTLKADRVYIVQPHPLGNVAFLSIQFEVKRKGIAGMRENVQDMPMSEVAVFCKEMAENLYLTYHDIEEEVPDKVAKSILCANGSTAAIVKRLNNAHDWVGSIFCEFTTECKTDDETAREVLHDAATNIQFILPKIVDKASFDIG